MGEGRSGHQWLGAGVWSHGGYRPTWISVIGTNSSPRFSGAWVKDGAGFWTYWNMNAAGLGQNVTNILAQGGRPICLSGYGPSGSLLFAGALDLCATTSMDVEFRAL